MSTGVRPILRANPARGWTGRLLLAAVLALAANLALSGLRVEHDASLVTLLAAAVVAAGALALTSLDAATRVPWSVERTDARPHTGEDTRTSTFRRLVEIHQTSRRADDAVLWQLAELADRRVRQVHGFRPVDDPARTAELLGPVLAGLLASDRRHRYRPGTRAPRYSVARLGELVRRIEEL